MNNTTSDYLKQVIISVMVSISPDWAISIDAVPISKETDDMKAKVLGTILRYVPSSESGIEGYYIGRISEDTKEKMLKGISEEKKKAVNDFLKDFTENVEKFNKRTNTKTRWSLYEDKYGELIRLITELRSHFVTKMRIGKNIEFFTTKEIKTFIKEQKMKTMKM